MANVQNLKPKDSNQSREEAKKNGAKGGKASGEARRKKKEFRETFETLLSMPLKSGKAADIEAIRNYAALQGKNITVQEAITISMVKKAIKGDIRAAEYIRDTIGEKPKEKIETDVDMSLNISIDYGDES